MNCSTATDGLEFALTEGTLTKDSGTYNFTKSLININGTQGLVLGTDRWDVSSLSTPDVNTEFHFPSSETKHMKCFFAIDSSQPFTSASYTDLIAQSWVENAYYNPNSGFLNGRDTISILLSTTVLFGLLAF